jgi:aryl-alcohol dehydrogenase-like predicted oxidoreductase
VDVYHLHGVPPEDYSFALQRLVPELFKLRDEGKIRFLGITESFTEDPRHRMLERALKDDCWDVVMVGFNMLNQSARSEVFKQALRKNVGTLVMFAVRRALSQTARLREIWTELKQRGLVDPRLREVENPLELLLQEKIVSTIPEAAYRYCRHEPGVHVVLTGTGNPDHLRANLDSLVKPPLPEAALRKLGAIFERVDSITGS